MTMKDDIYDEAALWHQGQDRDDFDWDGFTRWLEADPANRACYNEIALLDAEVDRRHAFVGVQMAEPTRQSDRLAPGNRTRWRVAAIGAVAGAAVAAISVPLLRPSEREASLVYRAAAGQVRSVALPGGTSATLAPGSTLVAHADDARRVRLNGTAFFDVRHDPAAPFTVQAGAFSVQDVGTRFDVSSEGGSLRVAVQAGSVSVGSEMFARPVVLQAGKALFVEPSRGVVEVSRRAPDAVGSWRQGRLVYDQAPLGLVAADVSRYSGRNIVVASDLAGRRFTGVITVEPGVSPVDTLKQLTGLDARVEGNTVRLVRGGGS